MTSPHAPALPPVPLVRYRVLGIIATATLLTLLYFARDVSVLVLTLTFGAVAVAIGVQLVHMSGNLPTYERTLERKIESLNDLTLKRVYMLTAQAGRVLNRSAGLPQPAFLLDGNRSRFINGISLPMDCGWLADASWNSLRLATRT